MMCAAIAQLVEQGTENPCVLGSIPSCGTILKDNKDNDFKPCPLFFVLANFLKMWLFCGYFFKKSQ